MAGDAADAGTTGAPRPGGGRALARALPGYEIGEELGRGAYGVVVAARHVRLGREVAVKQLSPSLAGDLEMGARFLAEARTLASLDHPHIVPIYDFVEIDGGCLLVMERLTGGTVKTRLGAGGFSAAAACAVMVATCAALDYAHDKGLLHRDIKPQNLLFSADGVVKVADFGIAKLVRAATGPVTRTGMLLGTPAYMAPEQIQGAELSPAVDVYAAGVVLYELLSGALPFPPGADPLTELYRHVHDEPVPLLARAPHIPASLAELTARALSRDPAERYASARELSEAIARAASAEWGPHWTSQTGVALRVSLPSTATEAPSHASTRPGARPASAEPPARGLEFKVLGALEVERDGQPVSLGGFRQRALLVVLVLSANRVVALDRLIEELWGEDAPAEATNALQTYISRLRRVLEPERAPREPARIVRSQAPGYVLAVDPAAIDAARFERWAAEGHSLLKAGRAEAARERLVEALALWRGPALCEFADEPFVRAETARLHELRLVALEDRVSAELALGEHGAVVGELERLLVEEPLRERLWAQLMLALYRAGRQGDALDAYQRCRSTLDDQLGIEPSPALKRLQDDILHQAPTLNWQPTAATQEPPVAPGAPKTGVGLRPQTRAALPLSEAGVLVGRDEPVRQLESAWAQARAGQGRLVLLAGEPGIGKTRLAEEIARRCVEHGRVVWGRCYEGEGAPVLWPWTQIIRDLLPDQPTGQVRAAIARAGCAPSDLAPLLPQWATPAEVGGDPREARFRLCQAASAALTAVADERPLLVVIDDLHWADAVSLQLLEVLSTNVAASRVLVIGTFRHQEVTDDNPLADTLGVLARRPSTQRLTLGGLTSDQVGQFIATQTGEQASAGLVSVVHDRTDGNPFFIGELVQLMRSEGALDDPVAAHRTPVPAGVRDVIRRRLARLPQQTNTLLTTAAVVGRDFDLILLERLLGLQGDQTLDHVELALMTGLVAESASMVGRYRFSHALVRETLYDGLGATRRARLHAKVAEALQQLNGHDDSVAATDLAHHFWQAVPAVGAAKALPYVLRAADVALSQLAYEQSEDQLRRALTLVESLPAGEERDRAELWTQSRLALLLAPLKGPSSPEATAAFGRARELCAHLEPNAEVLGTLFGQFGSAFLAADLDSAAAYARQLLEVAESSRDPRFLIAADEALGLTAANRGQLATARRHLEQSFIAADSLADPALARVIQADPRGWCRGYCALVIALTGDCDHALIMAREAIAAVAGNEVDVGIALETAAMVATVCRHTASARQFAEDAIEIGTKYAMPMMVAHDGIYRAWARTQEGDVDSSIAAVDRAIRELQDTGVRLWKSFHLALLAELQLRGGRPEDALVNIEAALAEVDATGDRFYEAELHRLRGEILLTATSDATGEAETCMQRAIEIAQAQEATLLAQRAQQSLQRLITPH